jgi:hypothetical protein
MENELIDTENSNNGLDTVKKKPKKKKTKAKVKSDMEDSQIDVANEHIEIKEDTPSINLDDKYKPKEVNEVDELPKKRKRKNSITKINKQLGFSNRI